MRYAKFDYQVTSDVGENATVQRTWDSYWRGQTGWEENLGNTSLWQTIRDHLSIPGRLLEAGCGTGRWVQFLNGLGHEAIGVDYAPSGLEVGRSYNPKLNLIQANCKKLPFEDNSFDYIVSIGTIAYDVNGPEESLREFWRVLKPNGTLMCSVPCLNLYRTIEYPWLVFCQWLKCRRALHRLWSKKCPLVFSHYVWSPAEYEDILKRCGFKLLEMRGYRTTLRSRYARFCDSAIKRMFPLSSCRMMMGICRK
jgi:ubiquinone/menaquinone biosynthesis C-methylase UbiE